MKKRKLKTRNLILLIIAFSLILCFFLEIGYTTWILDGKTLLIDASKEVKSCIKNHHILLGDCISSFNNNIKVNEIDNSVRYVGENPYNYIDINEKYDRTIYRGYSKTNEEDYKDYFDISSCLNDNRKCNVIYEKDDPVLWRIVGVFMIDGLSYTKLVRAESIGDISWDSSDEKINEGYGINAFEQSSLNYLLNEGAFYQKKIGNSYTAKAKQEALFDFTEIGLSQDVKNYIYKTNWYLGSVNENEIASLVGSDYLQRQDGENIKECLEGSFCNDDIERKNVVENDVGILTASDIFFASKEDECSTTKIDEWVNSECVASNWLLKNKKNLWLLNPISSSNSSAYALQYNKDTGFTPTFVSNNAEIYPVIYLKRNIKIKSGYGTKEKPFTIE